MSQEIFFSHQLFSY